MYNPKEVYLQAVYRVLHFLKRSPRKRSCLRKMSSYFWKPIRIKLRRINGGEEIYHGLLYLL